MRGTPATYLRRLTEQDIPCLTALSGVAGWNQTAADWGLLLRLHPEGCLGIECSGRIVATTTLICYGDQIAWLGMVLTQPDHRRRGFAKRLVESALSIAAAKGTRAIKLDATEQGAPLYEKLGFRSEQTIERWSGRTGANTSDAQTNSAEMPDFKMDFEAFGADRSEVLRALAAESPAVVSQNGFAMSRPGRHAAYFGPCVALALEPARLLASRSLSAPGSGEWLWDLLPANRDAVKLACEFGFTPVRKLVRMVKGDGIQGKESMIYAAGGFELG